MHILLLALVGAMGLASCAERLKTRDVSFGDCITSLYGKADSVMVIRSDSAYQAFQLLLSQRYPGNGADSCSFPKIDFSRQILVGAMVKIIGHDGASCDESAWYTSSDSLLEIHLSTSVEESGDSELRLLNYFTVEDVPEMDCKVRIYLDGEEIVGRSKMVPYVPPVPSAHPVPEVDSLALHDKDSLEAPVRTYSDATHFSFSTSIANGRYSMEILTYCLDDSLDERVAMSGDEWPVIQKQKLVFRKDEIAVRSFVLPIAQKAFPNRHQRMQMALDARIRSICVNHGTRDLFLVHGVGSCSGSLCPDFSGVYSMEGEDLYQGYSTKGKTKKSYKDFHVVLEDAGIHDPCLLCGRESETCVRVD